MAQFARLGYAWALVVTTLLGLRFPLSAIGQMTEFRGMWVTRYDGWASTNSSDVASKIDEIMKNLGDNRFNAVLFQIRPGAETFYPSPSEPWSEMVTGSSDFDPTEYAIDAAHANGLEFHAYINAFPCTGAGNPPRDHSHLYYRHCNTADPDACDWLIYNYAGQPVQDDTEYVMMSPGIPAVQAYVRQQVMYVVNHYDVQGIHFDRIRYPGGQPSYDPVSLSRYLGEGNPDGLGFADWTRDQITRFTWDMYAQIAEVKPAVTVSCAPFGDMNSAYYGVYQDPARWLATGGMDAVVPMIYGNFDYWLPRWLGVRSGRHVYAGMSVSGSGGIQGMIDDVFLVRNLGGEGTNPFSYKSIQSNDYWSYYTGPGGPYQTTATVPPLKWKTNPADGIIIGNVMGVDGASPVVDAQIRCNGSGITAISSGDGLYSFLKVPPGSYTLTFRKNACDAVPPLPCVVTAGQVTRLNVTMGHDAFVRIAGDKSDIRRGGRVRFTPKIGAPTGSGIASYTWHFGDADIAGTGTPGEIEHVYPDRGTYVVRLDVLPTNAGLAVSNELHIVVKPSPGDFNADDDVDQEDFGHFQTCLTGTGVAQTDSSCADSKLDGDADVDQDDLAVLVRCRTRADVLAIPGCEN